VRRIWLPTLLAVLIVATFFAGAALADRLGPVHWTCNGSEDCKESWYTSPVSVVWNIDPPASGSCPPITIRDDPGTTLTCKASAPNGEVTAFQPIKLDQKAPDISEARPDRPADHAGWYTHPVSFTATATDVTSGVDRCDPATYNGPDSPDARVLVTCRDYAGNVGSRPFPLRYDATAPDVSSASVTTGDRVVRLNWPAGADAKLVRTPGTSGSSSAVLYDGSGGGLTDRRVRNGRKYRYVLTLTDQAGNSASRELAAIPDRHLVAPAKRATVAGPPRLTWTPVRGARYYNVQLFRNGRKILSEWPRQASLQLKSKWRFHGKRYRLKPGEYRWYVWPGEGPRAENRYGRMVGKRSFTIAPS
jgi:hypothetical protein